MAIYTDSGVTLFDKTPRKVTFQPSSSLPPGSVGAPVYADGVPIAGTPHIMSINSGKLAGLIDVRDNITVTYQNQLDETARGLIETFQETDQSGGGLPPVAGLFTYGSSPPAAIPTSGTVSHGLAGSIKVNPTVDPSQGGNSDLVRDGGISGNAAYRYNTTPPAASYTDRILQLITDLDATRSFDPSSQIAQTGSVADYAKSSISWLEALRQSSSSDAETKQTLADRGIYVALAKHWRQFG